MDIFKQICIYQVCSSFSNVMTSNYNINDHNSNEYFELECCPTSVFVYKKMAQVWHMLKGYVRNEHLQTDFHSII
jgi:hypothetical protein